MPSSPLRIDFYDETRRYSRDKSAREGDSISLSTDNQSISEIQSREMAE